LPLIIILISGYGFNSNNLSSVVVGTHIGGELTSQVSQNILDNFQEKGFAVKKYSSLQDCILSVKTAENQICISIPGNLSLEGNLEEVVFYVDYSRTNLAYTLINSVREDVFVESSEVGEVLVQNLIDSLIESKRLLIEEKEILETISKGGNSIEELEENFYNPENSLDDIVSSLKNYENSSLIQEEINSLEEILEEVSLNSDNFDELNSEIDDLQEEISLAVNKVDSIIEYLNSVNLMDAEDVVSPIKTQINSIVPESTKREYFLPVVISLISLFGSFLISSTLVIKNKKTRAYFRNFVTPTRNLTFIFSTYFTCLIILLLQFILVFLGLHFIFHMNFFLMPLEIILTLILSWSVFIFLGMFLGYLFRSEETIIFASVLISSALIFFSNLILPLENISVKLFEIAQYNPFVILESSLKKIYFFNLTIVSLWQNLLVLLGFSLIFCLSTFLIRKLTKERL
jgi:ABC-type multidrug transport system permease subunit